MALELTDYERHYLLTNPDVLVILMDMHDMQQDQADSMGADCHGDELRHEELRQHGAKLIEADPEIWSDEIRRRFAEPSGHRLSRLTRAREHASSSGNGGVASASPCRLCEGWKRLAEMALEGAATDQRIKEIRERYGLDAAGVQNTDGGQR